MHGEKLKKKIEFCHFSGNKDCAYSTVSDHPVAVCVSEVASAAWRRSFRFCSLNIYLFSYYLTFCDAVSSGECMISQQGFGNGVGERCVA